MNSANRDDRQGRTEMPKGAHLMTEAPHRKLSVAVHMGRSYGTETGAVITVEDVASGINITELRLTHEQLGILIAGGRAVVDADVATEKTFQEVGSQAWHAQISIESRSFRESYEYRRDAVHEHLLVELKKIGQQNVASVKCRRNSSGNVIATVSGFAGDASRATEKARAYAVWLEHVCNEKGWDTSGPSYHPLRVGDVP